jgi:RNA-directed DNA polymerase
MPIPWPHREGTMPKPVMHGAEKSDPLVVPMKLANKAGQPAAESAEGSGGTKRNARLQSTVRTQSRDDVSQAQARIREAVTRNKKEKLTALLHHISIDALRWAFLNLRKDAAPGIDGLTWADYAANLEGNLADLHERVHRGAYRALPSRRRLIPKPDGRQRPLGIAALEDKIVQAAVVAILTPIYEAEFLGFSYGFRPGRSQHDALDALGYGIKGRYIWWILDADIRSFFDTISHDWLIRFVEHRIGDTRIIRLIQKWLKAGVLEEGQRLDTLEGTPQGAVISPLLANIYLHYVYDLWVHAWRKQRATGDLVVVRYADDTIVGFQHRSDADSFLSDLKERLARFSLTLHPEKTRLLEFGRFAARRRAKRGEGKPETFDFLGFTHICGTKRNGQGFQVRRKTQRKRRMAKLTAVAEELRSRRHQTIREQGQWLGAVLEGYYAYFAVPTNIASLRAMRHHIKVRWRMALQQRSQRQRMGWRRMERLADRYLPQPSILHPWPEQRFLVKHSR